MSGVYITFNGKRVVPNPEFINSAPKSVRKKWHDMLVFSDYKQGKGSLYEPKDKEYCCLGVGSLSYVTNRTIAHVGLPSMNTKFSKALNCAAPFNQNDYTPPSSYDPIIGIHKFKRGKRNVVEPLSASALNDNEDGGPQPKFSSIAKLIYPEAYQKRKR